LPDEPYFFDHNSKVHVYDFRSLKATALKNVGLKLCSWIFQEIAFLGFSYRMIRKRKITMIQANDPYIQGFNALLLSFATRVLLSSKSCAITIILIKRILVVYMFPILKFRALEKQ